jgi:hypothetical protein
MKTFKDILSEAKKSRGKYDHIEIPGHRREEYDDHYDKLSDRGGLSHDQIHEIVLKKMGLI